MTSRAGLVAMVALVLSGCGLPGDDGVQTVESDAVPYHLLDERPPRGDATVPDSTRRVPVVFWLVNAQRLAPAATGLSCGTAPDQLVARLLSELAAAPDDTERADGRDSAIPPESDLHLLGISDGVAQIEVDASTAISADRLPLAVGQIVMSVTSSAVVDRVSLVADGDVVPVPLPGGPLTSQPVSADDYAALLAERYHGDSGSSLLSVAHLGCRDG